MNSGRTKFILIVLIFMIPFAVSYYLSKDYLAGGKLETSNYGEFISPIINLADTEFVNHRDELVKTDTILGKWSLIYRVNMNCSSDCTDEIYLLRQVNIALGKDMNRVQRLVALSSDEQKFIDQLIENYPNLIIANNNDSSFSKMISKINDNKILLLTDPLGNVILGYEKDFNGKKLLKDIKKLLKLSKIG
tara:strand:+ start:65 stop:637 length:573 start_codon:yes stop_codon:yes gene_type:complete